jgi:hypothetical protein
MSSRPALRYGYAWSLNVAPLRIGQNQELVVRFAIRLYELMQRMRFAFEATLELH